MGSGSPLAVPVRPPTSTLVPNRRSRAYSRSSSFRLTLTANYLTFRRTSRILPLLNRPGALPTMPLHPPLPPAALPRALAPAATAALADPDVTEIYVNPSGALFFDTRSRGRVDSSTSLSPDHSAPPRARQTAIRGTPARSPAWRSP